MLHLHEDLRSRWHGPALWRPAVGADDVPENPGPMAAEHRAEDAIVQTAYSGFIRHTQACAECRTGGMNCAHASELRQVYRAAKRRAGEVR